MLLLERYKSWVRQHPGAVEGIERSLQLLTWFPDRFSSSEYALEGINAAVGLLGLWHESIVHNGAPSNGAAHSNGRNWALWLAAVEQVATLAEIRGMQLEKAGRMNRYSPLAVIEALKAALRLKAWAQAGTLVATEALHPEDEMHLAAQRDLRAVLQAFAALRKRYGADDAPQAAAGSSAPRHPGPCAGGDAPCRAAAGRAPCDACSAHSSHSGRPASHSHIDPVAMRAWRRASGGDLLAAAAEGGGADTHGVDDEPGPQASGRSPPEGDSASEHEAHASSSKAQRDGKLQQGRVPPHTADASSQTPAEPQQPAGAAAEPWPGVPVPSPWCQPAFPGGRGSLDAQCGVYRPTLNLEGLGMGAYGPAGAALPPGAWPPPWLPPGAPLPPGVLPPYAGPLPLGSGPPPEFWFAPGAGGPWGPPPPLPPGYWPPLDVAQPQGDTQYGDLPSLPSNPASPVEPSEDEKQAAALRQRLLGLRLMYAGELLHLIRPLLYVLLLRRQQKRGSWRPWLASLVIDLISQFLQARGSRLVSDGGAKALAPAAPNILGLALLRGLTASPLGPSEQRQLLLRRVGLARYAVRSPAFEAVTAPALRGAAAAASRVPLLGRGLALVAEVAEGMQRYYTYVEA